jgi:uncharacterized protein YlxW (UPF0749 family)
MLLLRNLVEDSLDEGYARAAARRATGEGPRRSRAVWLLGAGTLAVGLLLTTAYAQTQQRSGSAQAARAALVKQIETRSAANDRVQSQLVRQRAAVLRAQSRALALTSAGSALSAQLSELEAATGAGPVKGPGMVVRLDDATDKNGGSVDPRTDETNPGRVTDRDLQTVVNEVWAAGAEAVAVNGQRLTALSAIRSAGDAILVDFRPLNPPYEIQAVGDAHSLRTSFVAGFGGSYLQVLQGYGITYAVEDRDRLQLPASAGVRLRYAAAPAASDGSADTKGNAK